MSVKHISSQEQFQKEVVSFDGLSLVDFWAEWCGPCRMIGPELEKLAIDNIGKNVQIVKVNVDENPELASIFQVSSIPVVFFLISGEVVDKIVGANPKSVYQSRIDELNVSANKI